MPDLLRLTLISTDISPIPLRVRLACLVNFVRVQIDLVAKPGLDVGVHEVCAAHHHLQIFIYI